MALWSVLRSFGIFYGHLEYFGFLLVYFSRFGMLYEEKSGNTAAAGEKNETIEFPFKWESAGKS
jgi:hypothetical protein